MNEIEGHTTVKFQTATELDHDEILEVWEASVRETHDFVDPADILAFRPLVRQMLSEVDVVLTRDDEGRISAFAGVSGDKIEMLFAHPRYIGKGIGKRLFWHAVCELHAKKLDVNENNEKAVNFYLRQGCKVIDRSPLDASGRPYPILHLECLHTE